MSFPHGDGERAETLLSYRDVTSPINQEDYHLDSSGGKGIISIICSFIFLSILHLISHSDEESILLLLQIVP